MVASGAAGKSYIKRVLRLILENCKLIKVDNTEKNEYNVKLLNKIKLAGSYY